MKITRPLYQIAVRGELYGVGTFRNTIYGAVLTRTTRPTTRSTPASNAARWRFAVESSRSKLSAESIADYLARRLPMLASNDQTRQTRHHQLDAATPQLSLSSLIYTTAVNRSPQP